MIAIAPPSSQLAGLHPRGQLALEAAAVVEAGEVVVVDEVAQLLLGATCGR